MLLLFCIVDLSFKLISNQICFLPRWKPENRIPWKLYEKENRVLLLLLLLLLLLFRSDFWRWKQRFFSEFIVLLFYFSFSVTLLYLLWLGFYMFFYFCVYFFVSIQLLVHSSLILCLFVCLFVCLFACLLFVGFFFFFLRKKQLPVS